MDLLLITILGTVIGTLLAVEAKAWMPYLSARMVRSTLDGMPTELDDEMRLRWGEEIEGDLNAYSDRPLGELQFAVRLRRKGGRQLAAELMLDRVLKGATDTQGISEAKFEPSEGLLTVKARFHVDSEAFILEDADGHVVQRLSSLGDRDLHERLYAGETVEFVAKVPRLEKDGS